MKSIEQVAREKVEALKAADMLPKDADVDAVAKRATQALENDDVFWATIEAMVAAKAAWA